MPQSRSEGEEEEDPSSWGIDSEPPELLGITG